MMKNILSIYITCIKNDICSQVSYLKDFIVQLIVWSIYSILPFFSIILLVQNFGKVGDFGTMQIAILYGVIHVSYDIARMFARGFDNFPQLLHSGDLDIFFIRPLPIVFQIFSSSVFIRRLAGIIQGLFIILWGCSSYHYQLSLLIVIMYSIFLTCILYVSLLIIYSSICFITIKDNLFANLIIDSSVSVGYYPIEYIKKPVRTVFTYIVPIAVCVYYPLKPILLNEGLDFTILCIAGFVTLLCMIFSIMIFQYCKRFYKSTNN